MAKFVILTALPRSKANLGSRRIAGAGGYNSKVYPTWTIPLRPLIIAQMSVGSPPVAWRSQGTSVMYAGSRRPLRKLLAVVSTFALTVPRCICLRRCSTQYCSGIINSYIDLLAQFHFNTLYEGLLSRPRQNRMWISGHARSLGCVRHHPVVIYYCHYCHRAASAWPLIQIYVFAIREYVET